MNIEVSGVFYANRGALLMLEAIREQMAEAFPGARLAVPLDWSIEKRLSHSVWGTTGSTKRGLQIRTLERLPYAVRKAGTFIPPREIDVLLDASGFGYGDTWGLDKLLRRLTSRLTEWKTSSKRAIMLPQALGPFEKPGMADAFRRAAEKLDLIYARDAASLRFVEDVLPSKSVVQRAPDFTNLLQPGLPPRLAHLRGASYVIPNEKMVAGKGDAVWDRYIAFLIDVVSAMREVGREPMLLLHEGRNDYRLAEALNASLEASLPIVDEPDALVTKAVIGSADLIVSSRFHGLVSALSAGVPALACGWSHKYRELMTDYGCEGDVVNLDGEGDKRAEVAAFLVRAGETSVRESILAHAAQEKTKSRNMWDEVIEVMRT